jgi:hypothetical protein
MLPMVASQLAPAVGNPLRERIGNPTTCGLHWAFNACPRIWIAHGEWLVGNPGP